MSVLIARATIRPESADTAEAGVRKMFAAINQVQPIGVRYASCQLQDRTTYVALVELEDGVENPLPKIPEWVQFQADLESWRAAPPILETFQVVGSYRLFDGSNSR